MNAPNPPSEHLTDPDRYYWESTCLKTTSSPNFIISPIFLNIIIFLLLNKGLIILMKFSYLLLRRANTRRLKNSFRENLKERLTIKTAIPKSLECHISGIRISKTFGYYHSSFIIILISKTMSVYSDYLTEFHIFLFRHGWLR